MEDKYYHSKETVQEYIKAAEGYDGNFLIEKLMTYLPNGKLLELGSGPGKDWKTLSKNYEVIGSDDSNIFLDYLNENYPLGKFIQIDASNIKLDDQFDGIYSNKVLHHLTNEQLGKSITLQKKALLTNGIICHSFWKGEGDEEFKGMYVNYHMAIDLKKLFETDFEILVLEEYKEFEEKDSILLIAKKKE